MQDGILNVIQEIKIGKIVIGKQGKKSNKYEEFYNIIKNKRIPVEVAKKGDIINIEKDIKIKILFPENNLIEENVLNNNSLIAKLEYKNFKMLFTGDIEEVAEKKILEIYSPEELKSDILKVPHHGSKTSTSIEFLKAVNPSISLIGVGKNNKFGHPNSEILRRLEHCGSKIYRTDKMGEISIFTNGEKKISVNCKYCIK